MRYASKPIIDFLLERYVDGRQPTEIKDPQALIKDVLGVAFEGGFPGFYGVVHPLTQSAIIAGADTVGSEKRMIHVTHC